MEGVAVLSGLRRDDAIAQTNQSQNLVDAACLSRVGVNIFPRGLFDLRLLFV